MSLRDILEQLVRVAARQRPDETMEAVLVAERAIEKLFAMPTGILSVPGDLTDEEAETLRKRYLSAAKSGVPRWLHDVNAGGNCRVQGCYYFADGDRRHNEPGEEPVEPRGSVWD